MGDPVSAAVCAGADGIPTRVIYRGLGSFRWTFGMELGHDGGNNTARDVRDWGLIFCDAWLYSCSLWPPKWSPMRWVCSYLLSEIWWIPFKGSLMLRPLWLWRRTWWCRWQQSGLSWKLYWDPDYAAPFRGVAQYYIFIHGCGGRGRGGSHGDRLYSGGGFEAAVTCLTICCSCCHIELWYKLVLSSSSGIVGLHSPLLQTVILEQAGAVQLLHENFHHICFSDDDPVIVQRVYLHADKFAAEIDEVHVRRIALFSLHAIFSWLRKTGPVFIWATVVWKVWYW